MESIKELRKICQKDEVLGKPRNDSIHKNISIYITYILIPTRITANQVTILSIFSGLIGGFLLAFSNISLNLVGFFSLYLYLFFDNIDGEIARYRKQRSVKGVFLDELTHLLGPPAFFVGIGFNLFFKTGSVIPLSIGFLSAILIVLLRAGKNVPYAIFSKKVLTEGMESLLEDEIKLTKKETSSTKIRISFAPLIRHFTMLVVFVLAYVSDLIIPSFHLFYWTLIFYFIIVLLSFMIQAVFNFITIENRIKSINKIIKLNKETSPNQENTTQN